MCAACTGRNVCPACFVLSACRDLHRRRGTVSNAPAQARVNLNATNGTSRLKKVSFRAEAQVLPEADLPALKWAPADEQGVVDFLVGEKNFSEERVRKQVQKMNASRSKANQGAPWVSWSRAHGCTGCRGFGRMECAGAGQQARHALQQVRKVSAGRSKASQGAPQGCCGQAMQLGRACSSGR